MTRSLKIYVAGPYTAPTPEARLRNVQDAMDAALRLFAKGHYPYVPHLTHDLDERATTHHKPMTWDDWIAWDAVWLEACDALLYLAPSRGADLELAAAQKMGLPICRSVDDVPAALRTGSTRLP